MRNGEHAHGLDTGKTMRSQKTESNMFCVNFATNFTTLLFAREGLYNGNL